MNIHIIFILVILFTLVILIFVQKNNQNSNYYDYPITIVKNNKWILIHIKNKLDNNIKIYKIYKNKFPIY